MIPLTYESGNELVGNLLESRWYNRTRFQGLKIIQISGVKSGFDSIGNEIEIKEVLVPRFLNNLQSNEFKAIIKDYLSRKQDTIYPAIEIRVWNVNLSKNWIKDMPFIIHACKQFAQYPQEPQCVIKTVRVNELTKSIIIHLKYKLGLKVVLPENRIPYDYLLQYYPYNYSTF